MRQKAPFLGLSLMWINMLHDLKPNEIKCCLMTFKFPSMAQHSRVIICCMIIPAQMFANGRLIACCPVHVPGCIEVRSRCSVVCTVLSVHLWPYPGLTQRWPHLDTEQYCDHRHTRGSGAIHTALDIVWPQQASIIHGNTRKQLDFHFPKKNIWL